MNVAVTHVEMPLYRNVLVVNNFPGDRDVGDRPAANPSAVVGDRAVLSRARRVRHDSHVVLLGVRAAFDEAWKVGAEGDVGAYWGLWDRHGLPKYV